MSIAYTWEVTALKKRDEGEFKDAVVQTYWKKIGTDDNGNVGEFSGATPFSTKGLETTENFTPFEELTEAVVLGWIQAVVVGDYEKHVNEQIQKQIDAKAGPVVEAALPWAPAKAPETPAN